MGTIEDAIASMPPHMREQMAGTNGEARKLKREMAEMAERAAAEISDLRNSLTRIAPRAEAFDALQQVLGMMPRPSRGEGEDMAWRLKNRAAELRAELSASATSTTETD